jgi:excisionase family DNA binding protein
MNYAFPVHTEIPLTFDGGMEQLLTVAEAAAYLRVSRATLWRWCQDGRVPALKIGREWRILLRPVLQQLTAEDRPLQRTRDPEAVLPKAPVL